jgi:hypothetical protein
MSSHLNSAGLFMRTDASVSRFRRPRPDWAGILRQAVHLMRADNAHRVDRPRDPCTADSGQQGTTVYASWVWISTTGLGTTGGATSTSYLLGKSYCL